MGGSRPNGRGRRTWIRADDRVGGDRGRHRDPRVLRHRLLPGPHIPVTMRPGTGGVRSRCQGAPLDFPAPMGLFAVFGITNDGLNLAVNLLLLFLVVFWLALVYWTYADARRRT